MKKTFYIVLFILFFPLSGFSAPAASQTSAEKISLFTVAPELLFALWRVQHFYGDPNMQQGSIEHRSFLLGSIDGFRDEWYDRGFIFNSNITQFLNSNFSGGHHHGKYRYDGSANYFVALDTGKAGLWSAGGILLHGESSWLANRSINPDVGSLLPANFDATMPVLNRSETTLSEAYLVQALPHNFIFLGGKINFSGLADQSYFANNENFQFDYTGLVNNPLLGAFVPYTPLGLGLIWASENKKNSVAVIALDADGRANLSGFDTVFNGNTTYGAQYQYSTDINHRPGNYRAIVGYTSKNPYNFAIDPRHLLAEVLGIVPVERKRDNYGLMLNFDQYLWLAPVLGKNDNYRKDLPPLGLGIFGRAGWAPDDRNVIDQFYSFGIGGYGSPFAYRPFDNWGIGYAYTHISAKLRNALKFVDLRSNEQGFEIFYNYAIVPSVNLTVNLEAIRSPISARKTAFAGGGRLYVML